MAYFLELNGLASRRLQHNSTIGIFCETLNIFRNRLFSSLRGRGGQFLNTLNGTETCHFLGLDLSSRKEIMGVISTIFGRFTELRGYSFQGFCGIMGPVLEKILQMSKIYGEFYTIFGIVV